MSPRTSTQAGLVLAVSIALSGCSSSPHAPGVPSNEPFATTYHIDVGALPAYNKFQASDIDASIDACVDFSAHANGKWMAATALPESSIRWNAFDILAKRSNAVQIQLLDQAKALASPNTIEKMLGDIWATGLDMQTRNAQGIAPLEDELAAIDALSDMSAIVAHIQRMSALGRPTLVSIGVYPDFNAPEQAIAYAVEGGLGLRDPSLYSNPDTIARYQAHAEQLLVLSGAGRADAHQMAEQAVALEARLAGKAPTAEETADFTGMYNPLAVADADALTPNFSWTDFFLAQGIPRPEVVSMSAARFHQEMSEALADTDPSVWRAYLRFRALDDSAPHLSEAFSKQHFEFHRKAMQGASQISTIEERVLKAVNANAGEALGQLYVHSHFSEEAKVRAETVIGAVMAALKSRIERLAWMSDSTKQQALEKWAKVAFKIGYPAQALDWSSVQTDRHSYLGNLRAAQAFTHRLTLADIGAPTDRNRWDYNPQDIGAYYHPLNNEMVFPAALLQPPFFDPAGDAATNYGGLGAVIGHELLHAFDRNGSQFGPSGKLSNWWSAEDEDQFKRLGDDLIRQSAAYRILGKPINAEMTLNENIADLGGLSVAYDALQSVSAGNADVLDDGLTRDQRFFYSWATVWRGKTTPEYQELLLATDHHAPDQVRAYAAPTNLPAFAAAFQCKPGSPMVRTDADRVRIW